MHYLITKLKQEHRQFIQIMEVLRTQLDRLGSPDNLSVDYDLMSNVVHYIAAYPNHWHHPFENIMFSKLLKTTNANQQLIVKLGREHGRIEALTQSLQHYLDDIKTDTIVPISHILTVGKEFLTVQYEHLFLEEDVAFPMCQKCFTEKDWADIEAHIISVEDPIFGTTTARQYESLLANSMTYADKFRVEDWQDETALPNQQGFTGSRNIGSKSPLI